MDFPVNERVIEGFQKLSKEAAIMVILIGIAVLFGWAFDIAVLKSIVRVWNPMAPNTALCFMLSGLALLLLQQKKATSTNPTDTDSIGMHGFVFPKIAAYIFVSIVVFIASFTLADIIFSLNTGINALLFKPVFYDKNLPSAGQMSWITAVNFLLTGSSLFLLNLKSPRGYYFVQSLILLAAGLAFFVFLDYLYYATYLFENISNVKVAFNTSIAFILLTSGIFFARPARGIMAVVCSDTLGGTLIRKYFPILIIVLVVFSELRYVGQQLGLYSNELGLAMMITFSIMVISYMFWMAANYLGEVDIKRRILEKETKKNERKFQTAFNLGSVPMTIQNLTTREFTEVNNVSLELFGFKRDEVIGHTTQELNIIDKERGDQINKILKEKGSLYNEEVELYKKNGEKVNTLVSIEVIELDNQKYFQSVIVDITEKKKTEAALKNSEMFLNSIVENIPNMIFVKDANDLRFIRFNKAGEELLGYSRKELIGKNDYDFFPKTEADFFTEKDKKVLETGQLLLIKEEPIHTKYQGERILETKKIPILDDKGKALYLLGISNDITEFKKNLSDLAKKTKDLEISNQELEQFAYVASHDLQEPLRTITNFMGLVKQKYSANFDKENEQYFHLITIAVSRMQQLIKDLLDYSRVGRNIVFQTVDCNKILTEIIINMDVSIKENQAEITASILPVLMGNETELKRLFQNLISNAIKFHSKNVVPKITITVEEKDTEYLFAIKDNGIGIEEKYFNKLFVIFQRLNTTDQYQGTGIGLATCKKIVNLHNGKIWVESKLGEGSTFYFTISKQLKNNIQ